MVAIEVVFQSERGRGGFGGAGEGAEGGEAGPVLEVDFLGAVEGGVGGAEEVFGADDLGGEEGC